jgi:DNA-binding protein YbaB
MAEVSNPELIEEMRWQLRKIEERKADNARLLAESVTLTSPDGTVTVVTAGGLVQEVRLSQDAMRSDAATLSARITAALRGVAAPTPAPQPIRVPRRRPTPAEDDDEPYDTVFDE